MSNTWNKFQDQLSEPDLCGACGQFYEIADQGADGYHSPDLCDAVEEINQINCNLCGSDIKDLATARIVEPFGETCGNCISQISKEIN